MRKLALGLVAALSSACFYTEVINVPPVAAIARVDPSAPVRARGKLKVTARPSTDPDGDDLLYEWRGRQGGPSSFASGAADFEYQLNGHEPVTIELVVRDVHGASSSASLTVEVGNGGPELLPPLLEGSRNEDNRFVFSRPVSITAAASDPDGDAIVEYTFTLQRPPGSDPALMLFERTGFDTFRLEPDVAGDWVVTMVAKDAYGSGPPRSVTIVVAPDAAPYIAAMQPPWALDSRVILLRSAGAHDFVVASVVDDLDAYPGSANAHFRWWVRLPGGPLAEVPGHDSAELTVDPADFDAGDLLEVRVEVSDRRDRPLPCAAAQPACSLTSDDRYQRITWTVEVR